MIRRSSLTSRMVLLCVFAIPILSDTAIYQPTKGKSDEDPKTLAIGAYAPDFHLKGVDGKIYSLKSFSNAGILVVVFMCNHCPTSQAYEQRMIRLTRDYSLKNVAVVAINPNHPGSVRLDELGYSDLGDSFEEMKIRAHDAGFNFPYLYDGDTEISSRKYGPVCTPHIFIFDKNRKLQYNGRIDDTEDPGRQPRNQDARSAIEAILHDQPIAQPVTRVFGCSIKWEEKKVWAEKAANTWDHEPVKLDTIHLEAVRELVKNHTNKLRLINVWATWCVPCVEEFPGLVYLNHMYRDRGYEMVSISLDDSTHEMQALDFLQKNQSSSPNYRYAGADKYQFIETLDSNWQGALPYTLLIEPGGKKVYMKQGVNGIDQLKKIIFDDPFMGRIYK
jgi:thiol-disulfide isomerase/thioredoxin